MSIGWIKLHRKLLDWEWYSKPVVKSIFIHSLLRANHKDGNWQGIEIKKGSYISSVDKLIKELGHTRQEIRTAIKHLKLTNELTTSSGSQHTVFTVVNYENYQEVTSEATNEQPTANQRTTTNKNVKNEKNKKNKELYQQIADSWNEVFKDTDLPLVKKVTQKREQAIKGCIEEMKGTDFDFNLLDTWERAFNYAKGIKFLMGVNDRGWTMTFDFITTKSALIKLVEGVYDNDKN